jgi:hypothetical protein
MEGAPALSSLARPSWASPTKRVQEAAKRCRVGPASGDEQAQSAASTPTRQAPRGVMFFVEVRAWRPLGEWDTTSPPGPAERQKWVQSQSPT